MSRAQLHHHYHQQQHQQHINSNSNCSCNGTASQVVPACWDMTVVPAAVVCGVGEARHLQHKAWGYKTC